MATPDLSGEAEALIRALQGVVRARISTSRGRIESIHVTARDDQAALHMAAHVRSALLAGLGTPVTPACIQVDVAPGPTADGMAPRPPLELEGSDRVRLVHDHRPASTNGVTAQEPADEQNAVADPLRPIIHETSLTARPRLVSIDAVRTGNGRISCRVAIAYRTRVHRAEAVAVDLPGSAAQAAAQATVRALIDAGITGIELSGLREVEIAGRDYVLVALRRTDPYTRTRSGSAPIIGSPERSAAEATVAAAIATT